MASDDPSEVARQELLSCQQHAAAVLASAYVRWQARAEEATCNVLLNWCSRLALPVQGGQMGRCVLGSSSRCVFPGLSRAEAVRLGVRTGPGLHPGSGRLLALLCSSLRTPRSHCVPVLLRYRLEPSVCPTPQDPQRPGSMYTYRTISLPYEHECPRTARQSCCELRCQ